MVMEPINTLRFWRWWRTPQTLIIWRSGDWIPQVSINSSFSTTKSHMESNHILDRPTPLSSCFLPTFFNTQDFQFPPKMSYALEDSRLNMVHLYTSPMKRKENRSKPNLRGDMFQPLIFRGVSKVACYVCNSPKDGNKSPRCNSASKNLKDSSRSSGPFPEIKANSAWCTKDSNEDLKLFGSAGFFGRWWKSVKEMSPN